MRVSEMRLLNAFGRLATTEYTLHYTILPRSTGFLDLAWGKPAHAQAGRGDIHHDLSVLLRLLRLLRLLLRLRPRRVGLARRRDVVNARSPLVLLVHRIEADEVLLCVARHLRRRPRDNKVAANAPPIALAELVESAEKETVLLLRPRNALAALLVARRLPAAALR